MITRRSRKLFSPVNMHTKVRQGITPSRRVGLWRLRAESPALGQRKTDARRSQLPAVPSATPTTNPEHARGYLEVRGIASPNHGEAEINFLASRRVKCRFLGRKRPRLRRKGGGVATRVSSFSGEYGRWHPSQSGAQAKSCRSCGSHKPYIGLRRNRRPARIS